MTLVDQLWQWWLWWTSPALLHENVMNFASGAGLGQFTDQWSAIFINFWNIITSIAPYAGVLLTFSLLALLSDAVISGDPGALVDWWVNIVDAGAHIASIGAGGIAWIGALLGFVA